MTLYTEKDVENLVIATEVLIGIATFVVDKSIGDDAFDRLVIEAVRQAETAIVDVGHMPVGRRA